MATVFISYTHDNEQHRERVRVLANRLRSDLCQTGTEVVTDHDKDPNEGWTSWSERLAEKSEIVLLVFTETYAKCWYGEHPSGVRSGGTEETKIIKERCVGVGDGISFARTIVFSEEDRKNVPLLIRSLECYNGNTDCGKLIAWIRQTLLSSPGKEERFTTTDWPDELPQFSWNMADHKRVRDLMRGLLCSRADKRILLLTGEQHHGKTHLANYFLSQVALLHGLTCGFFDFKGSEYRPSAFNPFLQQLRLDSAIGSGLRPRDRFSVVLAELRTRARPTVLIFGNYDHIADSAEWITEELFHEARVGHWLRVVILGQSGPEGNWLDSAEVLYGLNRPSVDDWCEYVQERRPGTTQEEIETVYRLANGRPATMTQVFFPTE